jgi:uncharacterized damage-inducible protein DinB
LRKLEEAIMDFDRRHFSLLARYNRDANIVLLDLLSGVSSDELCRERGSYFGSIQGILDHIIAGDINWLRRFRELFGKDEPLNRDRLLPAGHEWTLYVFPGFGEYSRARSEVDAVFIDWIRIADTSRFGEVLRYKDSHGNARRYYFREILDHVFNHQTHHRGQVSQILDEMGVKHDFSNILGSLEIPPD